MLSGDLVKKLVGLSDEKINYFLIRNFTNADFNSYLPELLQTIKEGQGYYAKIAIEHMPDETLCSPLSQEFFAEYYPHLDYFTQIALLESLNSEDLTEDLKISLSQDRGERNSYKGELISELLNPH